LLIFIEIGVANIPEALPQRQKKTLTIKVWLGHNAVTVAHVLLLANSAVTITYLSGNMASSVKTPGLLPIGRGFERYLSS